MYDSPQIQENANPPENPRRVKRHYTPLDLADPQLKHAIRVHVNILVQNHPTITRSGR